MLTRSEIDPDRLSFTTALQEARDRVIQAAGIIAQATADLTGRIGAAVLHELMPARRVRIRPEQSNA